MKKYALILLGSLVNVLAMAAPITPDQARQQAEEFLARRGTGHGTMRMVKQQPRLAQAQQAGDAAYYVFNIGEEQGFVIVSGDDRTTPVLGYARSGQFSEQDMPDNMRAWLEGYADQIRWMDEHGYSNTTTPRRIAKHSIDPLLTTTWNQDEPYNNAIPVIPGTSSTRPVTGCVATAMAQVIAYQGMVKGQTIGTTAVIPGYTCATTWNSTGQIEITDKAITQFDCSKLLPSYDGSYATEQSAEVAKLMAYCGASVNMEYRPSSRGGSSASDSEVAPALREYFGMDAIFETRDNYTYTEWMDLIYSELAVGRPVFYGGQSSGGGHAFVIDGYDGDELFHVNWGWGGSSDGDFVLSVLNPHNNSGIGASSSSDGYSFDQHATIGVKPSETPTGTKDAQLTFKDVTASGNTLSAEVWNYSGTDGVYDFGIGYMNNGVLTPIVSIWYNNTLANGYGWIGTQTFTITQNDLANLEAGSYKFFTISKLHENSTWYTEMDGINYYIDAIVDANKNVTLVAHPTGVLNVKSISFTGTKYVNENQTAEVAIQNTGEEFYGQLYFFASQDASNKGQYKSKGGLTITAHSTTTSQFTFKPTATGEWYVWVCTDEEGSNAIGQSEVTITDAPNVTTSNNVELTFAQEVTNADGSNVIGDKAVVKITVTNNTSTNYQGGIYLYTWKWNNNSGSAEGDGKTEMIPANSTVELTRESFELTGAEKYSFTLMYIKGNQQTESNEKMYDFYTTVPFYTEIDINGNKLIKKANSTISIDAKTCAIDLRGQNVITSVSSITNPNTLFLIDENATVPTGAVNVVKGTTAEQITLTDDGTHGFYSPITFTANNISYTRTFDKGYNNGSGWTTITLPFTVSKVQALKGDDPNNATSWSDIDWYRNGTDKGKDFWVMAFDGDDGSRVTFTQAATMEANQPYIITVPGAQFAERYRLTDKPIVFKGEDVTIKGNNPKAIVTGNSYKMAGTMSTTGTAANAYSLNSEGSSFIKGSTMEAPFRAYFLPTSTATQSTSLDIAFGGNSTGIDLIPTADVVLPTQNTLFDLQGRRLNGQPTHGIYIVNGKKIIK